MWDLSCPDWADRIRAGRSLIPDLPLDETEAQMGLEFFDELQLPDVPGLPSMRTSAGDWFRRLVRTVFGSWLPEEQERMIRDFLVMVPKGSSKTTYSAGLALTVMMMNQRPRAEGLFVGPTQKIATTAYDQAVGMIEASAELKRRFKPRDHEKTIEDLSNGAELRIKTFDANILTGGILIFALVDEIHLLGRMANASRVMRQIRGGLEKTPEGVLVMTTTQSDEMPAGLFKDELHQARRIRDGEFRGQNIRPMLPILYEFPPEIAKDPEAWQDTDNWPMVMPNLGKSVHLDSLSRDWESERAKGDHAIRIWASQHLNIEIGIGLQTDSWAGGEFWLLRADRSLTIEALIARSEVIVVGVDGGGLDDLFGLVVLGREKGTKRWLAWCHAWAHRIVLDRRKSIASVLLDFEKAEELTFVDAKDDEMLGDMTGIVSIVADIKASGLLGAVVLDSEGPYGELVDALDEIGVSDASGQIKGVKQGIFLMHAIKTAERKLANGTLIHNGTGLMAWCVGNLKIEATATAIRATKQNAGDRKIDPIMALFDAVSFMQTNPAAETTVYEERGIRVV